MNIEELVRELPDPEGARRFWERLAGEQPRAARRLAADAGLLSDALALAAWSPLLATTLAQNAEHLTWLARERADGHVRAVEELGESLARFALTHTGDEPQVVLARFRRRELLRVYLRDIRGTATVVETTEELSNLADAILSHALGLARQELDNRYGAPLCTDERGRKTTASFCVVALGKLGSRELNYSSDIDLLFLYSDDGETSGAGERGATTNREYFNRLAERVARIVGAQRAGEGAAYRVDLRLRPHGRDGALAVSVAEALRYYRETAHAWELQALIRARPSAGAPALYARFADGIRARVYTHAGSVEQALSNVRLAKQKIDRQHGDPARGFNVKLGRGGVREIEFIAQALQLAHGGLDPWLHAPHTLISLGRLADRGFITERERTDLSSAYHFLRALEHRLQMEHGLQTHTVPEDAARRALVARRMNFAGADALSGFNAALADHTARVAAAYARVFGTAADTTEQTPDHSDLALTGDARNASRPSSDRAPDSPDASGPSIVSSEHESEGQPAATSSQDKQAATSSQDKQAATLSQDELAAALAKDGQASTSSQGERVGVSSQEGSAVSSKEGSAASLKEEPAAVSLRGVSAVASSKHEDDAESAALHAAAEVFARHVAGASAARVEGLLREGAAGSLNARRASSLLARVAASLDKSGESLSLSEENLHALARLCGASEFFGELIAASPALAAALAHAGLDETRDSDAGVRHGLSPTGGRDSESDGGRDFRAVLRAAVDGERSFRAELAALRRAWSRLLVETGARDAAGVLPLGESNRLQTELATASVNVALLVARRELARRFGRLDAGPRLAVLGLGRLGSGGMDYGSDLDIVIVFDERTASPVRALAREEAYGRLCELLTAALSTVTREGYLYRVDLRLRPDGNSGPLARGTGSFAEYLAARADVWEWLAYVKLRAVGGDLELGRAFESRARSLVHAAARACDAERLRQETRRVRERLERERAPRPQSALDIKFGAGGMLDVYFAARYLQLRDGLPDDGPDRSTPATLSRLRDAGSLDTSTHAALAEGYSLLRSLDHQLRLVAGRSTRLPAASDHPTLRDLTLRLGFDTPAALLDSLRARMRAIRAAYERVTETMNEER